MGALIAQDVDSSSTLAAELWMKSCGCDESWGTLLLRWELQRSVSVQDWDRSVLWPEPSLPGGRGGVLLLD